LALAALLTSSCGARLMKLPPGPGTPASDARDALAEATDACHAVLSLTAEAAVSGAVDGQRLRATLNIGVVQPDLIRLEAFAMGQPMFLFVARGNAATLLLQRDNRIQEWRRVPALAAHKCAWARRWAFQVSAAAAGA
jgi:hypothetical protein